MIFTTWWDSPAKRCQIIFLKMFVKKSFSIGLAISCEFAFYYFRKILIYVLHDPKFFFVSFLTYECQKTQKFTLISNPWKLFEKSVPRKVICQKLVRVRSTEEAKLQLCTLLLPVTFLLANFLHFLNRFQISVKFWVVLIPICKFCE